MAYRKQRVKALGEAVERTMAELSLTEPAAHDAWLDAPALAAALASDEAQVLMRIGGELKEAEDGFAAVPDDNMWLLVERGQTVKTATRDGVEERRVDSVKLMRVTEPCCDSPKCDHERTIERLHIVLDGDPWLVGECFGEMGLPAVAAALGERLEVTPEGLSDDEAIDAAGATPSPPLRAEHLARWTLRREGELFVLRDHASHGPREAAAREWAAMALMVLGGVGGWIAAYGAYRDQSYQTLAIASAVALVLSLASWAMFHIASHSSKYAANSEALFYAARDQFVVAPWHARDGAVNIRPEGRYGAALRAKELEDIEVVTEVGGGFTLRAHSSHGAYDIGTLESEEQAKAWRGAVSRLVSRVAHGSVVLAAAVFWLGCGNNASNELVVHPAPPPSTSASPSPAASAPSPSPTASATAAAPSHATLKIIEDDLDKAMAEGKESGRPVFVEVWAPWCHTCLSMKNFVMHDASIVALQKRAVFAAIDSDRPVNAPFMDKYTVMVWPTLYVIDPADGGVLGLWQGAASTAELRRFINDAVDAREAKLDDTGPVSAMLAAKKAHAEANWSVAAKHYQQAIDRGGESWSRRSEALAGLQFSLFRRGNWKRCAEIGRDHIATIEGAAVPADFAWVTLRCAREAKGSLGTSARDKAIARLRQHTDNPPADASVDDKSDALSMLAGELEASDAAGAKAAILKQIALLEAAAKAAPGPREASTFDYARMNAYLAVGQGDKAVAMLTQRIEQIPDGYEAPARLAQTYMSLKRYPKARTAIARAIEHAYGARKLRYLSMQARIHRALKDTAAERRSLEHLLIHYRTLSAGQQKHPPTKSLADRAKKRLSR